MGTDAIIGGADGPTSILLTEKLGGSWFNTFGLVIMIFLMIPNIIFAIKSRGQENKCTNKAMNIIEQIGRYGSMFLMIFNIGILDYGCASVTGYIIYLVGSGILIMAYWIAWMLYFIKPELVVGMALAIIPTILFLLSGFMLRQYLLVITAVIFGIGHIYVTSQNAKKL
jgi:hypothetical protein